jgi:hypothetical protein
VTANRDRVSRSAVTAEAPAGDATSVIVGAPIAT